MTETLKTKKRDCRATHFVIHALTATVFGGLALGKAPEDVKSYKNSNSINSSNPKEMDNANQLDIFPNLGLEWNIERFFLNSIELINFPKNSTKKEYFEIKKYWINAFADIFSRTPIISEGEYLFLINFIETNPLAYKKILCHALKLESELDIPDYVVFQVLSKMKAEKNRIQPDYDKLVLDLSINLELYENTKNEYLAFKIRKDIKFLGEALAKRLNFNLSMKELLELLTTAQP